MRVQQRAGNRCPVNLLGIVIQQFMQAALTTPVAQAFPLIASHLLK
ncbi:hypothetical protein CES85_1692 [Ochrobactrum quorumnocens]|uniref:Uncharacterized protein n=1 Tax=Ochrobactrum quorumnocens TaxID=271865 RepID=A0A248UE83_9HYPH|nr:hypothetical protein CES85_1692 [[Ochrobactrum] quorumnocens]